MKARTKTATQQAPSSVPGNDVRRHAWRRRNERAGRAKVRMDRDRARGGVRAVEDSHVKGFDGSSFDQESHSDSSLLDVEFDQDELGEFILGQAGSVARAISHEEDEAFWL